MKWVSCLILSAILVGCTPLPGPDKPPSKPEAVPLSRADLCEQLGGYVDKGRIKSADDLLRVLGIMKDAGNWTDADSKAIDAALPDLVKANRLLTAEDAAKIKAIK